MMKFLLAAVAAVQLAQVHGNAHSATAAGTFQKGWDNHLAGFGGQNLTQIKLDYASISEIFVYDMANDINTKYSGVEGADKLFTALFAQLGPLDKSNFGVDHLTVNADTKDVFLVWHCASANLAKVTDTFLFDEQGVILRQNIVLWPVDAAAAKAADPPNDAPRSPGDNAGPVSMAWNNHAKAFGGQDMTLMLDDYTEDSVIEIFDAAQSFSVKFEGLAGVKDCFKSIFADLGNMSESGFAAPLLHVEEADKAGDADHDGMVFLAWKAPNAGMASSTDTFIFNKAGKITKQTIVTMADLTKYKGPVVRGWDNHFAAFGGKDVAMIQKDYNEKSVVRIYNQNTGGITTDTGVAAIGTMFTGLFAALAKDSTPGTLAVKSLTVEQAGDFSHVFLVWECPGAGFQKVTDTFVFNPRNGMIVRQNIVVWSNDAAAVKGDKDGEASKIATSPSLIQSGWDNHFTAFGGKNLSKIMLDYTEESEIRLWSIKDEKLATFTGLEAIAALFTGLFAGLTSNDVGAPVVIVEDGLNNDKAGQVFLVWQAPGSGFMKVTDTFVFDANGKIIKQNIVAYDAALGPVEAWKQAVVQREIAAIKAAIAAKKCNGRARRAAHLSGDCAALNALLAAEEKKVPTAAPTAAPVVTTAAPTDKAANDKAAFMKDMAAACANATKTRRASHAGKSCGQMKAMVEAGKIKAAMKAKNCAAAAATNATRTRRAAHLGGDCAALKKLLGAQDAIASGKVAEEKKVTTAAPVTNATAAAAATTVAGDDATTVAGDSAAANVAAGAAAVVAAVVAQLL